MIIALWVPKYNVSFDDPCCYPLGFMYISSVLRAAGHQVIVFNNNLSPHNPAALVFADCVLFTGFDEGMPENILLSAGMRRRGIHTVLGGACATFDSERYKDDFDAVVTGEGEGAVLSAIRHAGIHNAMPLDLDYIPWPDYHGFGIEEYHKRRSMKYMGVLASRGCPHSCTFCSSTCKFRLRSLTRVKDEIDFYVDRYCIDTVVMNDNTLNCTPDRLSDFSDMIRPKHLRWTAALRLDNLTDDSVRSAKDSGLSYAVVGVESFDQTVLDKVNKGITVKQIADGLDLLHKHDVNYSGSLLANSVDDIFKAMPYLDKYNVYPTGLKKFAGNRVEDAPAEVHDVCRDYAVSKGRTYGA